MQVFLSTILDFERAGSEFRVSSVTADNNQLEWRFCRKVRHGRGWVFELQDRIAASSLKVALERFFLGITDQEAIAMVDAIARKHGMSPKERARAIAGPDACLNCGGEGITSQLLNVDRDLHPRGKPGPCQLCKGTRIYIPQPMPKEVPAET